MRKKSILDKMMIRYELRFLLVIVLSLLTPQHKIFVLSLPRPTGKPSGRLQITRGKLLHTF